MIFLDKIRDWFKALYFIQFNHLICHEKPPHDKHSEGKQNRQIGTQNRERNLIPFKCNETNLVSPIQRVRSIPFWCGQKIWMNLTKEKTEFNFSAPHEIQKDEAAHTTVAYKNGRWAKEYNVHKYVFEL